MPTLVFQLLCGNHPYGDLKYDFPIQDVYPDFARLAMFGEQFNWAYYTVWVSQAFYQYVARDLHSYISTLEQDIPLGSVGYINPVNQEYSSSPGWEYEYKFSDTTLRLKAWTEGSTFVYLHLHLHFSLVIDEIRVYDIPVRVGDGWAMLYLTLGRTVSRKLQGDYLESWVLEHRQTISRVFGNDHPYARKHLDFGEEIFVLQTAC
ncbi:hypothetical protein F5146DRAFT_1001316 [Armillaria mellea]|nr:hypothetical protein F5146DRAFT_1001316 [Armillaria mellea]